MMEMETKKVVTFDKWEMVLIMRGNLVYLLRTSDLSMALGSEVQETCKCLWSYYHNPDIMGQTSNERWVKGACNPESCLYMMKIDYCVLKHWFGRFINLDVDNGVYGVDLSTGTLIPVPKPDEVMA
jgi:hypothetical protein